MRWALDLDIAAGLEIQGFARRQFQHQFLDEGCDVIVRTNSALPLFNAEHIFRYPYFQILENGHLAGKSLTFKRFTFVDQGRLGRK